MWKSKGEMRGGGEGGRRNLVDARAEPVRPEELVNALRLEMIVLSAGQMGDRGELLHQLLGRRIKRSVWERRARERGGCREEGSEGGRRREGGVRGGRTDGDEKGRREGECEPPCIQGELG